MHSKNSLENIASQIRVETLKIHLIAPETRIASSLSCLEILVCLYYGAILNFFPKSPKNQNRDRFFISKGHGSIAMYPILADLGFFPSEELKKVCTSEGFLGGIPDPIIPGYETVNGSLGHGMGVAAGSALRLKKTNSEIAVFILSGDGELHEGSCWEAAMFAAHNNLDNFNLIVDNNQISMLGRTEDVVDIGNLDKRFESFGFDVFKVNGHDIEALNTSLSNMKSTKNGKPKVLIADTIKGRGLVELENKPLCHVMNPSPESIQLEIKNATY